MEEAETIAEQQQAIIRIEQQLQIEKKLLNLSKDVNRVTKLSKSKIDTLTSLETRILLLRKKISDNLITTSEEDVDIAIKNKPDIGKYKLIECQRCKRKIISSLYNTHSNSCIQINDTFNKPIINTNQDKINELATFCPQPPRNCKVKSKGSDYIQWEWQSPITNGGAIITQYNIKYKEEFIYNEAITNRIKSTVTDYDILTSSWCLRQPVCHTGYTIRQLRASCNYIDFKIRCYNAKGWSEWVSMHSSFFHSTTTATSTGTSNTTGTSSSVVTTDPVTKPSQPLNGHVSKVTSSCIHLKWNKPHSNGGEIITHYIINYIIYDKVVTAQKTIHIDRPYTIRETVTDLTTNLNSDLTHLTSSSHFSTTLRNIPSETIVKKITIIAINQSNYQSDAYTIPGEYKTNKSSHFEVLNRQLNMAIMAKTNYIDTDFLSVCRTCILVCYMYVYTRLLVYIIYYTICTATRIIYYTDYTLYTLYTLYPPYSHTTHPIICYTIYIFYMRTLPYYIIYILSYTTLYTSNINALLTYYTIYYYSHMLYIQGVHQRLPRDEFITAVTKAMRRVKPTDEEREEARLWVRYTFISRCMCAVCVVYIVLLCVGDRDLVMCIPVTHVYTIIYILLTAVNIIIRCFS